MTPPGAPAYPLPPSRGETPDGDDLSPTGASTEGAFAKLVLPSRTGLIDLAHVISEKMAASAGFDEEGALDLGLAVREAVMNAMIHGNGVGSDRPVTITVHAGADDVRVRVRDRGRGFDPTATADPTAGENILKTSGRGLLLMRAFVDDVGFRFREGRGMEVTLVKRRRKTEDGA